MYIVGIVASLTVLALLFIYGFEYIINRCSHKYKIFEQKKLINVEDKLEKGYLYISKCENCGKLSHYWVLV